MKTYRLSLRWLPMALAFVLAPAALAQANFELYNPGLPVYDAAGVPLEGPRYLAELWGGPTTNSLAPAQNYMTLERMIIPFRKAGRFLSLETQRSIMSVPGHGVAWLQVRAWDARLGATYEEAVGKDLGAYGESNLFQARGGDPFAANPDLPGRLVGLQSFSLRPFTGVMMTNITRVGDTILLEWTGRSPRYQVQETTAIDGLWQDVGDPVPGPSYVYTNALAMPFRFCRVVGLPE